MQLKKNFVTLLAGISLLCCGMFMACENPSNVANENENQNEKTKDNPDNNQNDNEDEPEGIVLTWGNVPSDVKSVRIDTMIGDRSYTAFQINDLSKYKSITDKYVTKGKDYKYRIVTLDENGNGITWGDWFTVTAEGGSGELDFSATATSAGIKLASTDLPKNFEWVWTEKFNKKSGYNERIYIYQTDADGSFTDKFVDAGTEYKYILKVQVGYNSYKNNKNEKVPGTPLVEYPRFKTVNVTASAGSGSVDIKTLPAVNYNANTKTMTLTQKPEFVDNNITYWYMNIEYNNGKIGNRTFAEFDSENTAEKPSAQLNDNIPDGLWNFNDCWFCLTFEKDGKGAFRYEFGLYDLSDVPLSIPVNVNVADLFIPILTAKDEGIEISWDKSKLPAGTKKLAIQTGNNFFEIYDVDLTSIVDKYVEAGKTYSFSITARDENGKYLEQSETARVKATGGKGKLKIENKISITYDERKGSVTFSELPKLTDTPSDWNMNFNYNNSSNEYRTLFGLNSNNNILKYSLYDVSNGDWTFDDYWLNDNHDAYRYCQYEKTFDAFNVFPEKITVTDAYKPTLIATPVNEGIKFEWKNIPEGSSNWYVRLNKKDKESLTDLNLSSISVTSIIDKYVDVNSEYSCYIRWKNADGTWDSSKTISVTPTNGLGEAKITNQPAASFDSQNKTVIFETLPEFSALQDINWRCVFGYKLKETGDWDWIYNAIYKNNSNKVYSIFDETASGNWILCEYIVSFNDDDFEYKHYEDDISELNSIPNPILLSDENRFSLLATPVSDGIKLEWKNLPEGTKKLCIYDTNGFDSLFIINNPSAVNFVTDKYVDSGKKYSYRLRAIDENDREFQVVSANNIFATSGSGEKDITATAEDDGIHITFDKPASDCAIVILKSSSIENIRNSREYFDTGFEGSISDSVSEISFIDSFVTEGEKYSYLPYLRERGTNTNDFVEFPRYSIVTVTARSTGEKLEIINKPSGTYDETSKTLIITNAPQIASIKGAVKWDLCLFYNGYGLIFINDKSTSYTISDIVSSGSRTLNGYSIRLYYENNVRYHVQKSDVSIFSELPKTITF